MERGSDHFLYVLLADDDADDRMLFEDAVHELKLSVDLRTVKDGADLMNYLLGSGIIWPQLLFLDLNMPFKNGFQCLEEIRGLKAFDDMCIIIYSTTARPSDIEVAYAKGANLFIQKPNSFTVLKEILHKIFMADIFDLCTDKDQFEYRL